jgi:hypothetical protein
MPVDLVLYLYYSWQKSLVPIEQEIAWGPKQLWKNKLKETNVHPCQELTAGLPVYDQSLY